MHQTAHLGRVWRCTVVKMPQGQMINPLKVLSHALVQPLIEFLRAAAFSLFTVTSCVNLSVIHSIVPEEKYGLREIAICHEHWQCHKHHHPTQSGAPSLSNTSFLHRSNLKSAAGRHVRGIVLHTEIRPQAMIAPGIKLHLTQWIPFQCLVLDRRMNPICKEIVIWCENTSHWKSWHHRRPSGQALKPTRSPKNGLNQFSRSERVLLKSRKQT